MKILTPWSFAKDSEGDAWSIFDDKGYIVGKVFGRPDQIDRIKRLYMITAAPALFEACLKLNSAESFQDGVSQGRDIVGWINSRISKEVKS